MNIYDSLEPNTDKLFVETNTRVRQLGISLIKYSDMITEIIIRENVSDILEKVENIFKRLDKL